MQNRDKLLYCMAGSTQTLRQGLVEYYQKHPHLNLGHQFLGQNKAIVLSHDICHVVFGCGATSGDELIVETWTVLGTKITISQYAFMIRSGLFKEILQTFGIYRLTKRLLLTSIRVVFAVYSALALRNRWNHFGCASYADIELSKIRKEFGIHIV